MKLDSPMTAMVFAILVALALPLIDKARGVTPRLTSREQLLRAVSNNGIAFLVLCIGLWFCLPSTPVLSTFGRPDTVADVTSPEKVLKYLQDYDDAVVRVSDTLHWLLFAGVFWMGWNVVAILRNGPGTPDRHDAEGRA